MLQGAGIVLWYLDRKPMLLVGKESLYIRDVLNNDTSFKRRFEREILEKEEFDTTTLTSMSEEDKLKEAKKTFSRRALELEGKLGLGTIKFDSPKKTETGYTVNFRYLPRDFKRGIIKGGIENDETPLQTILREVAEEVGINIPEKEQRKMVDLGECEKYAIFSLNIGAGARDIFLERINQRFIAKSGEIYEFSFKSLDEIEPLFPIFNRKSQCAISMFREKILPTITRGGKYSKTKKINKKNKQKKMYKKTYKKI